MNCRDYENPLTLGSADAIMNTCTPHLVSLWPTSLDKQSPQYSLTYSYSSAIQWDYSSCSSAVIERLVVDCL